MVFLGSALWTEPFLPHRRLGESELFLLAVVGEAHRCNVKGSGTLNAVSELVFGDSSLFADTTVMLLLDLVLLVIQPTLRQRKIIVNSILSCISSQNGSVIPNFLFPGVLFIGQNLSMLVLQQLLVVW